MKKGAHFDIHMKRRFVLWRCWDSSKPMVNFIGLNPSTADENNDDPTIRRCISFAKAWGYGGIKMFNLFTYVTPYPSDLKHDRYPNEKKDDFSWIHMYNDERGPTIFCWGNFRIAQERARELSIYFPNALCLGKNQNGSPKHPLYLKADTKPIKYH